MNKIQNIYVAGGWKDRKEIHKTMILPLVEKSFHITHDWTSIETDVCNRTVEMQRWYADMDMKGVQNADAVIVHMRDPQYPYRGTWTEIGAALALGKPVYIFAANDLVERTPGKVNVFFYGSGTKHYTKLSDLLNDIYLASMDQKNGM